MVSEYMIYSNDWLGLPPGLLLLSMPAVCF